jgi:hypothetical protein
LDKVAIPDKEISVGRGINHIIELDETRAGILNK